MRCVFAGCCCSSNHEVQRRFYTLDWVRSTRCFKVGRSPSGETQVAYPARYRSVLRDVVLRSLAYSRLDSTEDMIGHCTQLVVLLSTSRTSSTACLLPLGSNTNLEVYPSAARIRLAAIFRPGQFSYGITRVLLLTWWVHSGTLHLWCI